MRGLHIRQTQRPSPDASPQATGRWTGWGPCGTLASPSGGHSMTHDPGLQASPRQREQPARCRHQEAANTEVHEPSEPAGLPTRATSQPCGEARAPGGNRIEDCKVQQGRRGAEGLQTQSRPPSKPALQTLGTSVSTSRLSNVPGSGRGGPKTVPVRGVSQDSQPQGERWAVALWEERW